MSLVKIIFPFINKYAFLKEKWWHRLFIVIYFILFVILFIFSFIFYKSKNDTVVNNIKVIQTLQEYTANSEGKIVNTVPLFFDSKVLYGCVDGDHVSRLYYDDIKDNIICNSDIANNIDEIAKFMYLNSQDNKDVDSYTQQIKVALDKDESKRYCFRNKNLECDPGDIISFEYNIIFLVMSILFSSVTCYLLSIILQIVYYKGFIYVMYGDKYNIKQ